MPREEDSDAWRIPAGRHTHLPETPPATPAATAAAATAAATLAAVAAALNAASRPSRWPIAKSRFVPRPIVAPAAPGPGPAALAESAALASKLKAVGVRAMPTSRTGNCGPEALAAVLEHSVVCTETRGAFPRARHLARHVSEQRKLVVDEAEAGYFRMNRAGRDDLECAIAEYTPYSCFATWAAAMRRNAYIDALYLQAAGRYFNAVIMVTSAPGKGPREVFPQDPCLVGPHPT